jgi:hypothetical protein
MTDAALSQLCRMLAGEWRRDGAIVDHDGARLQCFGDTTSEQDLTNRAGIGQHSEQYGGTVSRFRRRRGNGRSIGRQRVGLAPITIPNGDGKASAKQPPRHRGAHQPGSEKSNLPIGHGRRPSNSSSI